MVKLELIVIRQAFVELPNMLTTKRMLKFNVVGFLRLKYANYEYFERFEATCRGLDVRFSLYPNCKSKLSIHNKKANFTEGINYR